MIVCTGLAYDPVTRDWTKPCRYVARNRMEAMLWVRSQRDWLKDLRIDGHPA